MTDDNTGSDSTESTMPPAGTEANGRTGNGAAATTPAATRPEDATTMSEDSSGSGASSTSTPVGTGGPRPPVPAWAKVVGGAVIVAAVGGGAYWLGQGGGDGSGDAATATSIPEESTATTEEPSADADGAGDLEELVEFEDPETGITLSYPASWTPLETTGEDPEVRLILSAGGLDSVLVRTVPLEAEIVTEEDLADVKAVTDGIISSAEVRVLQQRAIEIDGMPGYYYLYTFQETSSGREGAHAHYFLFRGSTMYVLVFQAVPTSNFDVLAPGFDAIAESLRVEPPAEGDAPAGESSSTTEPG